MRQRQEAAKKRPSGGRPAPRRLFSFDSLRKDKSSTDEPTSDAKRAKKATSRPAPLDLEKDSAAADNASITSASLASPSKLLTCCPRNLNYTTEAVYTKVIQVGQKKAFRQVVETAQTQQQGESRRFAEAIRIACWEVRFGETAQQAKQSASRRLVLHYICRSHSLLPPSVTSAASILTAGARIHGLRRPPSMSSMVPSSQSAPSITRLSRALTSTMSFNRPRDLPHEKLVLSTLLVPFLSPLAETSITNEQATAVETFEYVVRTWNATSPADELERCIWCCRAASRQEFCRRLSQCLTITTTSVILTRIFIISFRSISRRVPVGNGFIAAIRAGKCGPLSQSAVEKEYGVRYASNDSDNSIHTILVTESVIRCLTAGPDRERRWVLRTLLQECWPVDEGNAPATKLRACAQWRKLNLFLPAARALVSLPTDITDQESDIISGTIRTRVLHELGSVNEEDAGQIRREVVHLSLELLGKQSGEQQDYILSLLCSWLQTVSDWKINVETALQNLIADEPWTTVLRIIPGFVIKLPDGLQGPTLGLILPLVYKRMLLDPPDLPSPGLSRFLEVVSHAYPKIFYKPLFSCAAATKDATIVHQLKIMNVISRFLPDFWTRDPDMMSIALISSVHNPKANSTTDGPLPNSLRVGQLALTLELSEQIRLTRNVKDLATVAAVSKFATALEARLGLIIEARERTSAIPQPQRLVLCSLLRQIRLLIRSIRSAAWLPNVVSWILSWTNKDPDLEGFAGVDNVKLEAIGTFRQLEEIYRNVYTKDATAFSSKRKSATLSTTFERQASEQVSGASRSYEASFLELLVAVSGMLSADDHLELGPVLWSMHLVEANADVVAPACFLLMQFAERNPDGFIGLLNGDLHSADSSIRRRALEQLSVLFTWRFQLLAQEVILDRNHRRPFKLQRPPVLFVATDIGSSAFVYEDDTEDYKDINGFTIPSELRRRLSEIGWAQEDRVVDHRLQRIRTPMSLLPSQQLDKLDNEDSSSATVVEPPSPGASPEPSPTKSPNGNASLTRQESIVGRPGTKRRPVFVPALLGLFPAIALMTTDVDFAVADMARSILLDFMRDDPHFSLAIHNTADLPACEAHSPPGMAHHVLNHLAGLLKALARQTENPEPLRSYAYALPSIAKLFPQVNKSSLRELRRNKVDTFMIPSGLLWFTSNAPAGPMFPRELPTESNPFETLPPPLVYMVMVRTSQNLLFVSMLRRNPQDLKIVRKGISNFQLPSLSRSGVDEDLSLKDMIPERSHSPAAHRTAADTSILALSLTLARSYLLLIQQILLCISRHLNDRSELATLMDGLNRILLAHKDDIGVIAHVMLAYMTAATRFKRLFISGGGYMLFMPAVIKVYIEAENQPHIRQAIAYATQLFYTLHQESFVFQSFDALGPILSYSSSNSSWVSDGLASLFMSLRPGIASPTSDAAGILDLNKAQEREALMVSMAEEVPQTFFASLKRSRSSQDKTAVALPILEGYETKRFKMDDLVRLLLTVIAHNPGIQRAEHFLTLLGAFTPHLFGVSRSVQTVLRSGVDALGAILVTRATGRQKSVDPQAAQTTEQPEYEAMADSAPRTQNSAPSNHLNMRLEYLRLVVAYSNAGGQVTPSTMARVVELVRTVLKDSRSSAAKVGQFLSDFLGALLIRETHPDVKEVVATLASFAPLCTSFVDVLDLSESFNILHQVAVNPVYASDLAFARLIAQYCSIGIGACERLASEELLFTSPLRMPLVKLLEDSLTMDGADVIAELERSQLSYEFLAGVILPVTLTLRTSAGIVAESQWTEGARREVFSRTWLRLLNLSLSICEKNLTRHQDKSPSMPPADRRKSTEQANDTVSPLVKSLSIALQIVKIIVIRAEEDLSSASRGIWVQLGNRLKNLLADGDAMFALRVRDYSEPPSPALSPRTSTFGESQQNIFAFPSSISMHGRSTYNPPRMIDYLAWSMIEWCWLRRSPLMTQIRIFAQERIVNLTTELRLQGAVPLHSLCDPAAVASLQSSRNPGEVCTTQAHHLQLLLRPQFGASQWIGITSSDERHSIASSTLAPSQSLDSRQAGYARMPSPISPSGRTSQDSTTLKIRQQTTSVTDDQCKILAKERHHVSLPDQDDLQANTTVQQLMGYSSILLPLPGSSYSMDDDVIDVEPAAWTRNEALQAVVDETRELLGEFREGFGELGGESLVMVDSVPSFPSLHD
ncbi:hypothetical protein BC629DRAFT_1740217 [Irpex lacteus]|nr:hypothetical protein BC629DRAFT_1740217 [Irpex lacteus]